MMHSSDAASRAKMPSRNLLPPMAVQSAHIPCDLAFESFTVSYREAIATSDKQSYLTVAPHATGSRGSAGQARRHGSVAGGCRCWTRATWRPAPRRRPC